MVSSWLAIKEMSMLLGCPSPSPSTRVIAPTAHALRSCCGQHPNPSHPNPSPIFALNPPNPNPNPSPIFALNPSSSPVQSASTLLLGLLIARAPLDMQSGPGLLNVASIRRAVGLGSGLKLGLAL